MLGLVPVQFEMQKRKVLEDSYDNVPIFGPNGLLEDADQERIKQEQKKRRERKKQRPHGSDSDEDVPFFSRREEEQESQAVDEAQFRLATADSLASTPSKNEVEVQVSRSLYDAEDLVRVAAAKNEELHRQSYAQNNKVVYLAIDLAKSIADFLYLSS